MTDDVRNYGASVKRKVPAWKACDFFRRLQDCRVMLVLHGCLSSAENEKVKRRIAKRKANP